MTDDTMIDAVYALAQDGATVYAGRGSGLYRQEGESWLPAYETFELDEEMATTAVLAEQGLLLAGVQGGVLRSEDAGASWQAFRLLDPPSLVGALLMSPHFAEDRVLLAATFEDGIYYSDDAGETWLPGNIGLYDRHVFALGAAGTRFLAGTETGLYVSDTLGRSWEPLPFAQEPATILSLCVDAQGHIFAGTESQGLYRSSDGGQTWDQLGDTALEGAINAILDSGDALLVQSDDQLWRSSDGGSSWQPALDQGGITALSLGAAGQLVLGFEDGAIKPHSLA